MRSAAKKVGLELHQVVQKEVLDLEGALEQKARLQFPVVYSFVRGMTSRTQLADLRAIIVEL